MQGLLLVLQTGEQAGVCGGGHVRHAGMRALLLLLLLLRSYGEPET